jgi:hypothetical protein
MAADFDPSIEEQDRLSQEGSERRRIERDLDAEALKWLMAHKLGRRFMWRLLALSGVFQNPWRPSSHETAFRAGHMNLGQMVLAELHEHCLDRYVEMTKEQQSVARQHAGNARI